MKKYLFLPLFLLLIGWQNLLSQSDYTLTIERENDAVSYCAIATENNEVIAVVFRHGGYASSELIRIDVNGNIIDSRIFSPSRMISQIGKSIHKDTYLGVGWQWITNPFRSLLWLFEFDDEFNIQWEEIVDTLGIDANNARFQHWDNHYFVGTSGAFVYKITEYGKLIEKISVPCPGEPGPYAITDIDYIRQIPKTSNFLMNRTSEDFYTAVMDDDLNYLYSIYPTNTNKNPSIWAPLDLEFFNDTEFIRSGQIRVAHNDPRNLLAVKKMDTASRNEAQIRKFGYEGIDNGGGIPLQGCYPGGFKSLAMHSDYFFAGGFSFFPLYPPIIYPEHDNFFMVYAFNYDLDSLWATHIGNDAHYMLYYISPTPDGGCVLAGLRYDWRKGDQKYNAFIAKVSKPDFTSIPETEKPKPLVTIFPNPGNNQFLIQTELVNFTLQLYDLQGQLLLTQQNRKEVNTEKLPSGCYIYRVIADNGEAMHGKWVKR